MRHKASQHRGGNGQLRIIAGQWRGRKLPITNLEGLRPTPDRVRETVFNWLAPYVPGARLLDCFSGSGALAFEALSRGAAHACMLEKAGEAARLLSGNLELLQAKNATVINTDALQWLAQPAAAPFDLIFLDPPFRQGLLEKTCKRLAENGYTDTETLIYMEAEKGLALSSLMPEWVMIKEKVAGQVGYSLWQVQ
ncbi:16S rRNA (guanine(966)-N(2))-methyltransferase RsmD [Candidatus Sororendozoicomonas aggregata]|uniref:16S rRNA (guanine(966)-N(2))-methyltransferase RsmD n=1 Tax=Candidatus Sororendozoicomonas aggregata TaxID=3073239 RepID=UPI002ED48CA8